MEIEEANEDIPDSSITIPINLYSIMMSERPISVDEACRLRLLLFGSTCHTFGKGWMLQGFKFRTNHPYAMYQKRSGPCGLLAGVEAYILKELLFSNWRSYLEMDILHPAAKEKKEALARALAFILWQAGEDKEAVVAKREEEVILDESVTSSVLKEDGILEHIKLTHFQSLEDLTRYYCNYIKEAEMNGGCVLFLYSLLLTHGIDKIKQEMDSPDAPLIGADDGFCSQEVVNLILTGKAVPNLFNGDMELNSGSEETSLLRGIQKQSKIGFLSFSEYQGNSIVGTFYKDPEVPIWLLPEKNHFTVLFGTSKDIFKNPEKFTLHYVDCFQRGNEKVIFVVKPTAHSEPPEINRELPLVFQCILTRWPLADIEWKII